MAIRAPSKPFLLLDPRWCKRVQSAATVARYRKSHCGLLAPALHHLHEFSVGQDWRCRSRQKPVSRMRGRRTQLNILKSTALPPLIQLNRQRGKRRRLHFGFSLSPFCTCVRLTRLSSHGSLRQPTIIYTQEKNPRMDLHRGGK